MKIAKADVAPPLFLPRPGSRAWLGKQVGEELNALNTRKDAQRSISSLRVQMDRFRAPGAHFDAVLDMLSKSTSLGHSSHEIVYVMFPRPGSRAWLGKQVGGRNSMHSIPEKMRKFDLLPSGSNGQV